MAAMAYGQAVSEACFTKPAGHILDIAYAALWYFVINPPQPALPDGEAGSCYFMGRAG